MYLLCAIFLVTSGIASLTYQVVWLRLISQSLGSTHASVSTVLAAFFFGLAAGSYLAETFLKNRSDTLKSYILLEALIGLSGLGLLPVLLNLDLILSYAPRFGSEISLKFALAVLLLSIPTTCMGATFPVMASILVRQRQDMGKRISQLYSLNTFGAVLGAGLSGFILIPTIGLDGAIYFAVALNFAIVGAGLCVNRLFKLSVHQSVSTDSKHVCEPKNSYKQLAALILLFATGFVSIATQVGWTKYLAIFTGSTIYGFSAILTIFLTGIAVGSHTIRRHIDNFRSPELTVISILILLGISLMLSIAGLSILPDFQLAINDIRIPEPAKHGVRYLLTAIIIFPPTFLFGALFPLNLRLYCGSFEGVKKRIGRAYAFNTVASIFGAIFAGFWIIPEFGTSTLLTGVAIGTLMLPIMWLPLMNRWSARLSTIVVLFLAFSSTSFLPRIDFGELIKSVEYTSSSSEDQQFLFLKEGKTGVVSLVTIDGKTASLQNNGLKESEISLVDPNASLLIEGMLGLVPYMVHPKATSAFIVGYGGGITTRLLTRTDLENIHVVELEPAVVEAGKAIKNGPNIALDDPRVSLEFNDARNTLLVNDAIYDLIVSQPSHPWLAGSANVFTHEFWQIAKSRLSSDGVFSQWINLFNMDTETLKSLLRSFYDVFPHGFSLANMESGDLLLIGSKSEIKFNFPRMDRILSNPKIKPLMAGNGIKSYKDILWYFALSRREALAASEGVPLSTDTNLLPEVRLSAFSSGESKSLSPYDFLSITSQFDVLDFIAEEPEKTLFEYADYVFHWGNNWMIEKIVQQLDATSPDLARSINHIAMLQLGEAQAAAQLYSEHRNWQDRNHLLQAHSYLEQKKFLKVSLILKSVAPGILKNEILAEVLYKKGDWQALEKFRKSKGNAKIWYLIAKAKNDFQTAAKELIGFDLNSSSPLPALEIALRYYALKNDVFKMTEYADLLSKANKSESR